MHDPKPSTPTPEDPREREPIHDPPVDPEHDIEQIEPVRQAEPDEVVFDAEIVEQWGSMTTGSDPPDAASREASAYRGPAG